MRNITLDVNLIDIIFWDLKAIDSNPLPDNFVFIKCVNRSKLLINNKLTPTGNVVSGTVKRGKKVAVEKYELKFDLKQQV